MNSAIMKTMSWLVTFRDEGTEGDIFTKIRELHYECILMERYVSNNGKEIPQDIFNDLSTLAVFVQKMTGDKSKSDKAEADSNSIQQT